MALWSNTDASGSTPKGMATGFAATGTYANGVQLWANAQAQVFTTNQQVGVFGVDTTEQRLSATNNALSGHPGHAGWVLRKAGMGPIVSITTNPGNQSNVGNAYITFAGGGTGNTSANAQIFVNSISNVVTTIVVNTGGLFANTPVASISGNANCTFIITMGGRANRVMSETVVAMGSLTSDGSDDTIYPDS